MWSPVVNKSMNENVNRVEFSILLFYDFSFVPFRNGFVVFICVRFMSQMLVHVVCVYNKSELLIVLLVAGAFSKRTQFRAHTGYWTGTDCDFRSQIITRLNYQTCFN